MLSIKICINKETTAIDSSTAGRRDLHQYLLTVTEQLYA